MKHIINKPAQFALIVALSITLGQFIKAQPAFDRTATNEAIKTLKQRGQYDSLLEAFKEACQSNAPPDEPEAERAIGQTAKLLADDGAADDRFSQSVAISGDTAIVGAPYSDVANDNKGSAYIFVRNGTTWTQQQKLTAPDGAAGDEFGVSVAISGETAIVGAVFADTLNNEQGAAYIFVRSGTTWTQQQKLTAPDGAEFDLFGDSVAISGDTAIVGAPFKAAPNANQGAAYTFVRTGTTWTQQQKLTATGGAANDCFGFSVAVGGDKIIVGAPLSDASASSRLIGYGGSDNAAPLALSATDQGAAIFFVNAPLAPTAANVTVSGKVLTPDGRGLANAFVILTDNNGSTRMARTNAFGYYFFNEVAAGQTYIIAVRSKRYEFAPQIMTFNENVSDLNFIGNP